MGQTKASYTTTADRYKEQAIASLKKNPLETIIEARRLYATSKKARNLVETLVTHVAGTGLDLSPAPMWHFLPKMSDQKKKDCIVKDGFSFYYLRVLA